MDILDILLDILLKPPQPFIGLFLYLKSCGFDFISFPLTATTIADIRCQLVFVHGYEHVREIFISN